MTRADGILIVAVAVLALAVWPLTAGAAAGGDGRVSVSGPAGNTASTLDGSQRLVIEGTRGDVVVVISGGAVRVAESDCPDDICERIGSVSAAGSVIACVPNGVVVRVGGGGGDGFDARVR